MKVLRRVVTVLIGIALAAGVGLAAVSPAEAAPSKAVTWTNAQVIRWKDGDTVVTNRGTIRLIGVDTPETGRCGATTATKSAKKWAPAGSTVRLGNPKSVRDEDRYGRSLRYVVRKGVDVSRSQIVKGSKARYDSTDGYQWHPRQAGYHKADKAHKNYSCKKKKNRVVDPRPSQWGTAARSRPRSRATGHRTSTTCPVRGSTRSPDRRSASAPRVRRNGPGTASPRSEGSS